jgi:hypothetical protein
MSQGVSMKRRKIDPETKMAAVLEGLRGGSSMAAICRKYQISESLYYRWRDKFLEGGSQASNSWARGDHPVPCRHTFALPAAGAPWLRSSVYSYGSGKVPPHSLEALAGSMQPSRANIVPPNRFISSQTSNTSLQRGRISSCMEETKAAMVP